MLAVPIPDVSLLENYGKGRTSKQNIRESAPSLPVFTNVSSRKLSCYHHAPMCVFSVV